MSTLPRDRSVSETLDRIVSEGDRSRSFALLDRFLENHPKTKREPLDRALIAVADPRLVAPLHKVLEDRTAPPGLRRRAARILSACSVVDERQNQLLTWWNSEDSVLRRYALSSMGSKCPKVVLKVADSGYPLKAEALEQMRFLYEMPEHQQIKIRALKHCAPKVRLSAISALLWDEPLAAEAPLVEALQDSSDEVAVAAAGVLKYFPSKRVARALARRARSGPASVQTVAKRSLDELLQEFAQALTAGHSSQKLRVRRWLEPVWSLFDFEAYAPKPWTTTPILTVQTTIAEPLSPHRFLHILDDPDASCAALRRAFAQTDFSAFSSQERTALQSRLIRHVDPLVRERATDALAAWGAQHALLKMLDDPDRSVRKSAMYHLGRCPKTPRIAQVVWSMIEAGLCAGVHAVEALSAYVQHADQQSGSVPRLLGLAEDEGRAESLRTAAVRALCSLQAKEAVRSLAYILEREPGVTWALHIALLESFALFRLRPPRIEALQEADHLHLQRALGSGLLNESGR